MSVRAPRTLAPRQRAARALALVRDLAAGKAMPAEPTPLTPEAQHARLQELRAGLADAASDGPSPEPKP